MTSSELEIRLAPKEQQLGNQHLEVGQPVVVRRPNGYHKVFRVGSVGPKVSLVAMGRGGGEITVGFERLFRGGLTRGGSQILDLNGSFQALLREVKQVVGSEPDSLPDPLESGRKIGALLTLAELRKSRAL